MSLLCSGSSSFAAYIAKSTRPSKMKEESMGKNLGASI
jgi:hypothetical protein